jgi:hypothetical protein
MWAEKNRLGSCHAGSSLLLAIRMPIDHSWMESRGEEQLLKQAMGESPTLRDYYYILCRIRITFQAKMHDTFRILTLKRPFPEREEAQEIFLVPTLSPISDHRA